MDGIISERAIPTVLSLDTPWRFAPRGTYDPDNNTSGLVSFATAENTLVIDELLEFVEKKVTIPKEALRYAYSTGGGPRFPDVLAAFLNENFSPFQPLTGSNIQVVGAATAMHEILGWAIGDGGDAILTSNPVYGRFELDFGNKTGVRMVYAETDAETCFDLSVVSKFEETLQKCQNKNGPRIRAILIVNPNNPIGRCYPRNTIEALMRLCQKHRLHFISDEMYGCSVFHNTEDESLPNFTSALGIDTSNLIDPELCHVTYGLSKDFGLPGLRVGAIVTRGSSIHKAVKSVMRFHNPSGASIAIAITMLENAEWYRSFLQLSRSQIAQAYRHVTAGLRDLGIKYLPANAGFFVYIDLSPCLKSEDNSDAEFELAGRLQDAGVFLHPKEEHGNRGWFRMVYTQDPRTVTEGLIRIRRVIQV